MPTSSGGLKCRYCDATFTGGKGAMEKLLSHVRSRHGKARFSVMGRINQTICEKSKFADSALRESARSFGGPV